MKDMNVSSKDFTKLCNTRSKGKELFIALEMLSSVLKKNLYGKHTFFAFTSKKNYHEGHFTGLVVI